MIKKNVNKEISGDSYWIKEMDFICIYYKAYYTTTK